jgi:hypothetical protein
MGVDAFRQARGERGKTATAQTPVTIRDNGPDKTLDSERLRDALGRKLGKYATRLTRVLVATTDQSGPVGAPKVRATVTVTTTRLGVVVVTATGGTSWAATSAAIRSSERALRRRIERVRGARA